MAKGQMRSNREKTKPKKIVSERPFLWVLPPHLPFHFQKRHDAIYAWLDQHVGKAVY